MRRRCNSEIDPVAAITKSGFKCFQNSPNAVTYRAQLNSVLGATSMQLVNHIVEYVSSGPFLLVEGLLIKVDKTCNVPIMFRNVPECNPEDLTNIEAVIGGIVGGVVIIFLVLICFVLLLCTLNMKRRCYQFSRGMPKSR